MSKGMLGNLPLSEVRGPRDAFEEKLAGEDGAVWLTAFNRFLRKENPWPKILLWRKVGEMAIEVNLDAPPMLPFADATVEWVKPGQTGWVRVERIGDLLFVGGHDVLLHLDPGQQKGKSVLGHDLRKKLAEQSTLHPNILDALFENQHLLPEALKQNADGNTKFIYFWAVVYRYSVGYLFVRYVCFSDGQWHRRYSWLGSHWADQDPAAVSAS